MNIRASRRLIWGQSVQRTTLKVISGRPETSKVFELDSNAGLAKMKIYAEILETGESTTQQCQRQSH